MRKRFWKSGEPYVWTLGAILVVVLILICGLVGIVLYNSLSVFWPQAIYQIELKDGKKFLGELVKDEIYKENKQDKIRIQIKRGNRDIDQMDFVWIDQSLISNKQIAENAVSVERSENGNFYGFAKEFIGPNEERIADVNSYHKLKKSVDDQCILLEKKQESVYQSNLKINKSLSKLKNLIYENKRTGFVSDETTEQKLKEKLPKMSEVSYLFDNNFDFSFLQLEEKTIDEFRLLIDWNQELLVFKHEMESFEKEILKTKIVLQDINGIEKTISLKEIVRLIKPNQMSVVAKSKHYIAKVWELMFDKPRESNTEGGLFPAIVGTIAMVFLMSFLSFPLGVISGIYLREYAKEGFFIRLVRIAVNNLAGIPSIVYGIFGLGFFVYYLGRNIDSMFYPEFLPAPTFGTGGILWASLTLGILTVPVVIVATEEALSSIPREIRQGSLALGATQFQTLYGVLLPMASPGILTGFILAMSRAAGEVAPLMITGVVKHAPSLPIDGDFPYVHLERKFMHLGFQIYDVGFQSPNVEASTPMVYITTLLLLLVVFSLSIGAIILRSKMKKRYTVKSF
jgi:phosphate transport system permease protein